MHRWTSQFCATSSGSSFCSSSSPNTDESSIHKIRHRAGKRRLTRARKLRYLDDGDVNPHPALPLPLPALSILLSRDAAASVRRSSCLGAEADLPLPSPPSTGREKKDPRDDGPLNPQFEFRSRLGCQDCQKNKELCNAPWSQMSPQEFDKAKRLEESGATRMHASAPTSSFSTPELSPNRTYGDFSLSPYKFPQDFQVWSAPEMPALDHMYLRFSPRDLTTRSVDNSPVQSPTVSPKHRSPNEPQLHNSAKKLTLDTISAHRDSNSQAHIHPLPLPPVSTSPKPQWQKGKLIGRGTFGSVYVASNRQTGALCAMKEVELAFDDPKAAESIKQLEQEIKVLSRLKHPNIVQYYGSDIIGDRFYIYLEYVHPGSINKYIHEHSESMTESVVRNFTRHILSGLTYLHSKKTIHRDIKGANLLVDAHGVVKLADFGMSKHLSGPATNLSLKGSPYWMAPELLQSVMQKDASSDLALAVDIWSLGCTIIEMLDGKPPWCEYEGAAAMFKVMKETPPIPANLSREGKDFLRCCFRRNPAERPTASMLLEHRFLKNPLTLDVLACTAAIDKMTITYTPRSVMDQFNHKFDHLSPSPNAQTPALLQNKSTFQILTSSEINQDISMRLPT